MVFHRVLISAAGCWCTVPLLAPAPAPAVALVARGRLLLLRAMWVNVGGSTRSRLPVPEGGGPAAKPIERNCLLLGGLEALFAS